MVAADGRRMLLEPGCVPGRLIKVHHEHQDPEKRMRRNKVKQAFACTSPFGKNSINLIYFQRTINFTSM